MRMVVAAVMAAILCFECRSRSVASESEARNPRAGSPRTRLAHGASGDGFAGPARPALGAALAVGAARWRARHLPGTAGALRRDVVQRAGPAARRTGRRRHRVRL